jgi:hypothetical protein
MELGQERRRLSTGVVGDTSLDLLPFLFFISLVRYSKNLLFCSIRPGMVSVWPVLTRPGNTW